MSILYCRIGNYEFPVTKSAACGTPTAPVAVIEKASGQIEIFYQVLTAGATLYRWRTRDRGRSNTELTYTLKDETNANVSSSIVTRPLVHLVWSGALSKYFMVYCYSSKILLTIGALDINDNITWAQPTVVIPNVTYNRPYIIHNADGSMDVYYKVNNASLEEITKIRRSRDYGTTWTDVEYTETDPVTEVKKENMRVFNLPEIGKVGIISHDGKTMNHDYLTHKIDSKVELTENIGSTDIVPPQTPAVLRSATGEYYVSYLSGIGLSLSFARSNDRGVSWVQA